MILTIRTDKPESEIGLFDSQEKVAYETWEAHRQLAETIHIKIRDVISVQGWTLENITGIVIFKGPGSFTGLRIGMSVANTLAYSLDIPITAEGGEDWIAAGLKELELNPSKRPVVPKYGAAANVTKQKK
ncbi:MAG: tRNA (adenosine(37)-N6)-threonylcarbamoyltransferase complex dimerization subunit type 1 TsaB [Acidobacteriota bacterium]